MATALALFLAGRAVSAAAARAALGPAALNRMQELGVLEDAGSEVRSTVRLVAYRDLYVVSDFPRPVAAGIPGNLVMPVNFSSIGLHYFTVRRPAEQALDLGTGCGLQALLAAGHTGRVVGTDVNERALNMAGFNAWLNGLDDRVELRRGSLFEPVADDRFDLIVCSPPFVVSPDARVVYRDSGRPGDSLCEKIVRATPGFLRKGGFGHVLCNWALGPGEDDLAPPRRWLDGAGCAAVVLHHATYEPPAYATRWLGGDGGEADPAAVERWVAYYQAAGIAAVGAGAVIVRGGRPHWLAAYPTPRADIYYCGEQLAGLFAAQDYLHGLAGPGELLQRRLRLADGQVLERTFEAAGGRYVPRSARVRVAGGLAFQATVDPGAAELLARCDGARTLGEVVATLAAEAGADPAVLTEGCLPLAEAMVSIGALVPADLADPGQRGRRPSAGTGSNLT